VGCGDPVLYGDVMYPMSAFILWMMDWWWCVQMKKSRLSNMTEYVGGGVDCVSCMVIGIKDTSPAAWTSLSLSVTSSECN